MGQSHGRLTSDCDYGLSHHLWLLSSRKHTLWLLSSRKHTHSHVAVAVIESTVKGLVGVKGLGQWAWANHMEDLQVTVMMD